MSEAKLAAAQAARGLRAVALLAVCLVAPHVSHAQESFADASQAADAAAGTTVGKTFEESVGSAFGREHSTTIQSCAKETRRPEMSDFEILLRIRRDGGVERVLVQPATNLATCVKARLEGWKASSPPEGVSWVKIGVRLKRK